MKSALITGTSSGFGLATAVGLVELGWRVFAGVRDVGRVSALQDAAQGQAGSGALHVLELDVTDTASIQRAVDEALGRTGGTLDVLLNNAGYTSLGFFEDTSDANCRAVMETNFFGAVATTRAVLPAMRRAGHGRIGFVSSNAVNTPHPTMSMYAASKWAIEGFAEALAMEVAPFGIDVVVLQPGNHRTPFASHVRMIRPTDSAYDEIWDALLPGLSRLGAMGAAMETATPAFVAALTEPRPAFHRGIGNDVELMSWMKCNLSYEARASFIRRFVKFPGRPRRASPRATSRTSA